MSQPSPDQLSVSSGSTQTASTFLVAQAVDQAVEESIEDSGTQSDATNVLSIGSRGQAVRSLQIRLQEAGYYDGPIDGIYGLATQRSVRDFQASQDFDVTGRLDNATWEALESANEGREATFVDSAESDTEGDAESDAPSAASSEGTEEELPAVGDPVTSSAADAVTDPIEPAGGGLGRAIGLGLGFVALVASFGIGFFIANRSKEDAAADDGDGWGTVSGDADETALPSTTQTLATVSNQTGQNRVQSAAVASSGSLTTTSSALSASSGQMGGTALMAQSDIVEGLIQDLRNPDPAKRRKVIWELGQRGNSLAVNPLVDAMVTADSKEKSLVLAALSEIGIRSLKPMNRALAIALQDENPEVRKNAIRDLTRIYELVVQISQMLGHATEDEDPEVRQTASWALEQLNRIRRTQDVDSTMRAFPGGAAKPIDLLSSEASIRRSQS